MWNKIINTVFFCFFCIMTFWWKLSIFSTFIYFQICLCFGLKYDLNISSWDSPIYVLNTFLVIAPENQNTCRTRTMTGKMMAATVDLRIQRTAKQVICTRVKRCTRRRGTCRRNTKSGWCLAGMRYSFILSQN